MSTSVTISILVLLIIAGASGLLGVLVYIRGSKKLVNIFFSLIAIFSALWTLDSVLRYFYFIQIGDPPLVFTWASQIFALSIIYCFFLFVFSLGQKKLSLNPLWFFSSLFLCGLVVISILVPGLITKEVIFVYYTIQPVTVWGIGYYIIYIPTLFLFFLSGITHLFLQYKREKEEEKQKQYFYVFIATIAGGATGLIFGLLVPIIPSLVEFYWIGKVGVLIFIVLTSYAILKFHLFDLKVIVVEVTVLVLSIFLVVDILLATSFAERLTSIGLLVLTLVLGQFLSRAVKRSMQQREYMRELAQDITVANKNLEELDKQKTEFISLASHQLRTPLTAVIGYASMLSEGSFGKLEKETQKAIKEILEESRALSHAVENLLVVSRIEQGRVQYNYAEIGFRLLVRQVFQDWFQTAKEKGLEMTFETHGASRYEVWGDEEKLKKVVMNLVENAIQYTDAGFIRLRLSQIRSRGVLRFTISDTGRGMTTREMEDIFQNFKEGGLERKSLQTQANFKSDMGLYISKEFVGAHKGELWCESAGRDRGSTFFVEIPLYVKEDKKNTIV